MVDGLIPPGSGEVRIHGTLTRSPRRDVGVVFQSFNLFPWRTVAENVALGLENRRIPRGERKERVRKWLALVGLEGFEDFYPSQLSGGMQQRVGLARALAVEPGILLMDEPFGSVDAQTRLLMQGELMRIWAVDRKTVVFVTHDVEEALFPRPRTDALRGDPEFARLKESLWERLKTDISGVPEPAALAGGAKP